MGCFFAFSNSYGDLLGSLREFREFLGDRLGVPGGSVCVHLGSFGVPQGSLGGPRSSFEEVAAPMTLEGLSEILGVSWGYLGVIFVD